MRPIFQNTWNSSSVNSCLQDSSSSVVSAVTSTPTARKDYSAVVVKQQQQQGPSQYNHHHHHHHHQLQQQAANTTTWQQQQFRKQTDNDHRLERTASMKKVTSVPMVVEPSSELFNAAATNQSEMANIHLKLEEKRKQIENEKRRQEEKLNRQREKLGKAAFLQAISKDAELARKNSWIQRDFYAVTRDALNEIPHLQQRTAAMIHRSVGTDGFVQNFSSYPSPQVLYGNDDGQSFNSSYRHQNQQPTTSRPPPQLMTLMYTSPAGIVNNNNLRQTTTDVNNFSAPHDDLPPEAVSGNLSRALSNKLQIDGENGRHQLQKSSFAAPTRSATSSSPQYFQQQQCHHQQQPSIQKPAVDVIEKGFYICKTDNDDDNRRSPDGGGRSFAKSSVANGMQTVQRLNNLFHSNIGVSGSSSSSNTHGDDQFRGSNFLKRSTTGAIGLVIDAGEAKSQADDDEMERKKERILMLSLQRRQQQDEMKVRKEIEAQKKKEKEKEREEAKAKKKEEERKRRNIILTQYRLKKAIEDAERDGVDTSKMNKAAVAAIGSSHLIAGSSGRPPAAQLRRKTNAGRFPPRPRPKTIHVSSSRSNVNTPDMSDGSLTPTYAGQKGSSSSLSTTNSYVRRNYYRGSQDCLLAETARTSASSICSDVVDDSCVSSPSKSICGGRKNSYVNVGRDFSTAAAAGCSPFANRNANISSSNNNTNNTNNGTKSKNSSQKSNSLVNLSGGSNGDHESTSLQHPDPDSGLGKDDISSQGVLSPNRHHDDSNNNNNNAKNGGNNLSTSPSSGPGSMMMMMVNNGGNNNNNNNIRKARFDDAASESGGSEYSGLRLYKQPTVKSNRGIILNAVEYCVFPGAVNREGKRRVVEEINKSPDIKHFMVLFRDSGCQFRGLYSYNPDSNEEVTKLYGTGPRLVTDRMFDKFFKYNSGGKCFSQVHTKHLTVTIDAFTIHNSLWQGKKVHLPNKKDLSIVV